MWRSRLLSCALINATVLVALRVLAAVRSVISARRQNTKGGQQLSQIIQIFCLYWLWRQLQRHAHSCQHFAVYAFGLCQLAASLRKPACLLWVYFHRRYGLGPTSLSKLPVICASGLIYHQKQ